MFFKNVLSVAAFTVTMAELSSSDRDWWPEKPQIFLFGPLQQTFADPPNLGDHWHSRWPCCLHQVKMNHTRSVSYLHLSGLLSVSWQVKPPRRGGSLDRKSFKFSIPEVPSGYHGSYLRGRTRLNTHHLLGVAPTHWGNVTSLRPFAMSI